MFDRVRTVFGPTVKTLATPCPSTIVEPVLAPLIVSVSLIAFEPVCGLIETFSMYIPATTLITAFLVARFTASWIVGWQFTLAGSTQSICTLAAEARIADELTPATMSALTVVSQNGNRIAIPPILIVTGIQKVQPAPIWY